VLGDVDVEGLDKGDMLALIGGRGRVGRVGRGRKLDSPHKYEWCSEPCE
jgi:hypothetical protein